MSRARNVIVLRSPEISVVNGVRRSERARAIRRPASSIDLPAPGAALSSPSDRGAGCGRSNSPANVREIDASYTGAASGDARLTSSHATSAAPIGATTSAVKFLRPIDPNIRSELTIALVLLLDTGRPAHGRKLGGRTVLTPLSSDCHFWVRQPTGVTSRQRCVATRNRVPVPAVSGAGHGGTLHFANIRANIPAPSHDGPLKSRKRHGDMDK